jgi:hypothetical protein
LLSFRAASVPSTKRRAPPPAAAALKVHEALPKGGVKRTVERGSAAARSEEAKRPRPPPRSTPALPDAAPGRDGGPSSAALLMLLQHLARHPLSPAGAGGNAGAPHWHV